MLAVAAFGATVDGRVVNSVTGAGIADVTATLTVQGHFSYTATPETLPARTVLCSSRPRKECLVGIACATKT